MKHAREQVKPRKGVRLTVVLLVMFIAACLTGAAFAAYTVVKTEAEISQATYARETAPTEPSRPAVVSRSSHSAVEALPDNPIDFAALCEQNEDIYAWIRVPGTNVDYPIVQRAGDNEFYMNHDENTEPSSLGAIFTEDYNTTDFQDAVTLVYGHNVKDGLMFSTLHYFEDEQFFSDNTQFCIYVPGHVYTYDIVSAFTTDDRHILYRYGYFQTYEALREFEKEILDPHSLLQNTRSVKLDDSSKIVVLSTCNSGALEETSRYLVCGVRVDDQRTA